MTYYLFSSESKWRTLQCQIPFSNKQEFVINSGLYCFVHSSIPSNPNTFKCASNPKANRIFDGPVILSAVIYQNRGPNKKRLDILYKYTFMKGTDWVFVALPKFDTISSFIPLIAKKKVDLPSNSNLVPSVKSNTSRKSEF